MYNIPAQNIEGRDAIKNITLKSCRPMFKSHNLHLRNHHNKHLKHAYTRNVALNTITAVDGLSPDKP